MEIFKKNSKYSLEDVFNRHNELSKYEDTKKIEPRKSNNTFREESRSEKFHKKSLSKSCYSTIPVNFFNEILIDDSMLVQRTTMIAILTCLIGFLVAGAIAFVIPLDLSNFRAKGDPSVFKIIFFIISCCCFLSAITSTLGIDQINIDKKLGLFWKGPYFSNKGDIKGSIRCSAITDLKDISAVLLKLETRHTKNGYYNVYIVYLCCFEEHHIGSKIFESTSKEKSELVAENFSKFLSVELDRK